MIWTPPVVGKETDPKALEEYWNACCKLTLERFADLVLEELQAQLNNGLNNEDDLNRVQYFFHSLFLSTLSLSLSLFVDNSYHFSNHFV
jgi:hypothetical protein